MAGIIDSVDDLTDSDDDEIFEEYMDEVDNVSDGLDYDEEYDDYRAQVDSKHGIIVEDLDQYLDNERGKFYVDALLNSKTSYDELIDIGLNL